jgi:hypothetical protein
MRRQLEKTFKAGLVLLIFFLNPAHGAIHADSVNDWQIAYTNDGLLEQGELGWEYGYISNFSGTGGIYLGWHRSVLYWEQNSGINIFWPNGQTSPDVAWGEGGDSTGCRPPMHWSDGAYSWAGEMTNRWAATRRWGSDYTGAVDISGTVSRYFDPAIIMGWDVLFVVAINAQTLDSPPIYSRLLAWNDTGVYPFLVPSVPIKQGDTVNFLFIPLSLNASNGYIRLAAVIADPVELPSCDLNGNGVVDMKDFLIVAAYWQNQDCGDSNWCQQADLNYDWNVDLMDLSKLMSDWLTQSFPKADFDKNYTVDLADFSVLSQKWNAQDCDMDNWCQGCDLNRDRLVDLVDLNEMLTNWLTVVPVPIQDG